MNIYILLPDNNIIYLWSKNDVCLLLVFILVVKKPFKVSFWHNKVTFRILFYAQRYWSLARVILYTLDDFFKRKAPKSHPCYIVLAFLSVQKLRPSTWLIRTWTLFNSALQKRMRVLVKNIFWTYLLWDIFGEIHRCMPILFSTKKINSWWIGVHFSLKV